MLDGERALMKEDAEREKARLKEEAEQHKHEQEELAERKHELEMKMLAVSHCLACAVQHGPPCVSLSEIRVSVRGPSRVCRH